MNYLVSGKSPKRMGNAHPNIVPYQVFDCADGGRSFWRLGMMGNSRGSAPWRGDRTRTGLGHE